MSARHDDRLRALTHEDADFWADVVDNVLIVAVTDRNGIITYVNQKFCDVSQYSAAELLGQTHRILNSGTHTPAFFRDMYRTIYSGQTWHGNICNRTKDGSHYWVATTIIPHHGSDGNIIGCVAARFEITELMNTKERLKIQAATDTMTGLLNRGGFNASLHKTALERAKILKEARAGVKQNQFEVYYQPILNCHTGQIEQAEALMRWHHPQRGLLSAGAFTDVFADSGLAQEMETHLVQSFHDDIAMWKKAGLPNRRLAVNLSHLDLLSLDQQVDLLSEIKHLKMDPNTFMLEVTEHMLQGRRAEKSQMRLKSLAEDGFGLALDNFGHGSVRLSTLKNLPLKSLKIDRSLVRYIDTREQDRDILASLIKLGHGFGLSVTVEGVETRKQFDIAAELGVDYIQGFFISRAVSATDLVKITREHAWEHDLG